MNDDRLRKIAAETAEKCSQTFGKDRYSKIIEHSLRMAAACQAEESLEKVEVLVATERISVLKLWPKGEDYGQA